MDEVEKLIQTREQQQSYDTKLAADEIHYSRSKRPFDLVNDLKQIETT
jgi:hypothetical protein